MLSVIEYAQRRGVHRRAVYKAVARCGIPLMDGKLDPLVADTLWHARTDPDQQRRALGQNRRDPEQPSARGGPTPITPVAEDWRTRLEAAQAQRAELELKKLAGELVSRSAYDREIGAQLAGMKVQFDALPARGAAALGIDDEHRRKILQWLREEIGQIFASVEAPAEAAA